MRSYVSHVHIFWSHICAKHFENNLADIKQSKTVNRPSFQACLFFVVFYFFKILFSVYYCFRCLTNCLILLTHISFVSWRIQEQTGESSKWPPRVYWKSFGLFFFFFVFIVNIFLAIYYNVFLSKAPKTILPLFDLCPYTLYKYHYKFLWIL